MITVEELIQKLKIYPDDWRVFSYESCLVIVNPKNSISDQQVGTIDTPEIWERS